MVLSNILIQQAIDVGRLIIRPDPQPRRQTNAQKCPYNTHSVDLRLGDEVSVPRSGPFAFDLMQPGVMASFLANNSDTYRIDPQNGFALMRNQFLLAKTLEYIGLPLPSDADATTCLGARIEGMSSRARCGILVHFTAPTVHPGFEGTLTLEMINLGPAPFILRPGMPIAQLIIEEVSGIPFETKSQFHGQTTPTGDAAGLA
jgi:dCTP deaminase